MKGKCNERKCSMVPVLVTRRLLRRTAGGQRLWTGRLRGQDCQVKPGIIASRHAQQGLRTQHTKSELILGG